jgi:hypothetical protein
MKFGPLLDMHLDKHLDMGDRRPIGGFLNALVSKPRRGKLNEKRLARMGRRIELLRCPRLATR